MSKLVLGPLMTLLLASLLLAGVATAGGGEEPQPKRPKAVTPVKAPSASEAAARDRALDQARQAAPALPAPPPAPARTVAAPAPAPVRTTAASDTADWRLDSGDGRCTPLSQAPGQAGSIGRFDDPQDFARKMVQRGHQAFVLNIAADQVRVKVPDLDLNLLFVKPGLCRN